MQNNLALPVNKDIHTYDPVIPLSAYPLDLEILESEYQDQCIKMFTTALSVIEQPGITSDIYQQ